MCGPGRVLAPLLLGAAVALGADLSEARRLIAADTAEERRRGVDLLVEIDSEPAASALIDALRRVHQAYPQQRKAHDKVMEKFRDELWRASKELRAMTEEIRAKSGNRAERVQRAREINERILEKIEQYKEASRRFAPYSALITHGTEALERFRSDEATARIAEVARLERAGPLRNACIAAAGKRPDGLPMLLEVAADSDPRARAFAVRALATHVGQPAALACLGERLADSHWQVRLGAAAALASAPMRAAVPPLLEARRKASGEEAAALDRHLHGQTGLHFPDLQGWEAWWAENGESVRNGSFERGEGQPIPSAATHMFGLPLRSHNVLFVLDLSEDSRERAAEIRDKVAGAIGTLPDGARFGVIAINEKERRYSKRPAIASDRSRQDARRWLEGQEAAGIASIDRPLDAARSEYDGPVAAFEDLPDTIYLVVSGGKTDDVTLYLDAFRHWNRPVGAIVHAAALDPKGPIGLLHKLAADTGGAYAGPDPGD